MHILLLPSWYPKNSSDVSGVFFRDQALALHGHGHKVGVIAPAMRSMRTLGKGSSAHKLPSFENDCGLFTYRKEQLAALPRMPYGNYWLFKRAAKQLLKRYIADNGKPDILHAHAAVFGGAAGAELSEEFGIPLVLTEHSSGFARNLYAKWQLKLARQAINRAKQCIAVSPALAILLSEQFSTDKKNWKCIPNVVADRFNEPEKKSETNKATCYLNLALMTENKGQAELLNAFIELANDGIDAELWLAGDGPIRQKLEQTANDAGLADKVRFLGLVAPETVPKLLSQVDVMVVASHYETFGVVAAEALMSGLPVVATRCGGPECIVGDGDGLLVPPKQPEALAEAMRQLGSNLDNYDPKEIASNAKARFSGPAVAEQLTKEYARVLADNGAPTL